MDTIEDILKYNKALTGKRRIRILTDDDIVSLIEYAYANYSTPEKLLKHYELGGSVCNSYGYKAVTTIAHAAYDSNKQLVVGVSTCDAKKPTPGRCWSELQPFGRGKTEGLLRKATAWADGSGYDGRFKIGHQGANIYIKKNHPLY